jgi:hypothetical protein
MKFGIGVKGSQVLSQMHWMQRVLMLTDHINATLELLEI